MDPSPTHIHVFIIVFVYKAANLKQSMYISQ